MNVKYHSNQKTIDLYIAENASKITNQHQELVAVDLEDQAEDLADMVATEALDLVDAMIDHVKCLTQNAETVAMIVKYHSSQKTTDLYIAETVSKITNKIKKSF